MLKISELQIEAMRSALAEELYEGLLRFARAELPEYVAELDDDALRVRIREDAEAARTFGITSDRGITHFVGISLIAPKRERFWKRPEAAQILAPPDAEAKLEMFVNQVSVLAEKGYGG